MKNYLLIALAATALLPACSPDGVQDRYDEAGKVKKRSDYYENNRLEKSVYYEDGRESKTVSYEYTGKKLSVVRKQTADGKTTVEYKMTPSERIERKVTVVDGRPLQIITYDVDNKISKIQTLRKSGQVNCFIRYGLSGRPMDSLSAYIRYSYDPKQDLLEIHRINFADITAEKSQRHDKLTIGIVPGAIGSKTFNWQQGFPQPLYEGPFKSTHSVKLPKAIFKNGIASIYVYAGKKQDRFWGQGTEQWIQLKLDEAYTGYNWYVIE